ncbi:hypothetical protein LTR85_002247 [Meristemomyces frigidus]|nr:hypothetical protein LTR85_002247 [Meristemomyces frigidus]
MALPPHFSMKSLNSLRSEPRWLKYKDEVDMDELDAHFSRAMSQMTIGMERPASQSSDTSSVVRARPDSNVLGLDPCNDVGRTQSMTVPSLPSVNAGTQGFLHANTRPDTVTLGEAGGTPLNVPLRSSAFADSVRDAASLRRLTPTPDSYAARLKSLRGPIMAMASSSGLRMTSKKDSMLISRPLSQCTQFIAPPTA